MRLVNILQGTGYTIPETYILEDGKLSMFNARYASIPHIFEMRMKDLKDAVPDYEKRAKDGTLELHPAVTFLDTIGPCVVSFHTDGGSTWECLDTPEDWVWQVPNMQEAYLLEKELDNIAAKCTDFDDYYVLITVPNRVNDIKDAVSQFKKHLEENYDFDEEEESEEDED